jgi:hypothetical protein
MQTTLYYGSMCPEIGIAERILVEAFKSVMVLMPSHNIYLTDSRILRVFANPHELF